MPIYLKDLCVYVRTKSSLMSVGFTTLEEVCQLTGQQVVANTPNFGLHSLNNLKDAAKEHGMSLSKTPHPGYYNPPLQPFKPRKKPGLARRRKSA